MITDVACTSRSAAAAAARAGSDTGRLLVSAGATSMTHCRFAAGEPALSRPVDALAFESVASTLESAVSVRRCAWNSRFA